MSQKILVVDDSATAVAAIVSSLKGHGYEISTASDGDEGLLKAKTDAPDLVVLDVVMPGMNGFQLCRMLKRDPATKATKVVLVTSKDQPPDRFWGLRQGADAYVTKPFDSRLLLDTVASLL